MSSNIVIYDSKYGYSKQYAQWISEDLKCEYKSFSEVNNAERYDTIIFGSGLYASDIRKADKLKQFYDKNLVVYTVGLANPKNTDYSEIIEKNFSWDTDKKVKIFHLQGGIDYSILSPKDRAMMWFLKKFMIDKQDPESMTEDLRKMKESYGKEIDMMDRSSIQAIVEYVKAL